MTMEGLASPGELGLVVALAGAAWVALVDRTGAARWRALPSPLALVAGLWLWLGVPVALMGLGLTIRRVEARTGRLSLTTFRGLHVQRPTLAALFLLTGLAAVGKPGSVGFFGVEMLMDAATRSHRLLGFGVVVAGALGGIAVVRAYATIFLGARHGATVDLRIRRIELTTMLVLLVFLLGGSLWPQPRLSACRESASMILAARPAGILPD